MSDSLSNTHSFQERLRSYGNWPSWAAQEPKTLARAGFRFQNQRDLVKCDYCGGKFYNWKTQDDPVVEHMKYYPSCKHLSRLLPDAANSGEGEDIAPPSRSQSSLQGGRRVVADAVPSTSSTSTGRQTNASSSQAPSSSSYRKVPVPHVTSSDAKWVRSRMDLPFVQLVLAMGYKRSDVKKVLIANRNENKEVSDAVSLVKQIFELEDKEKRAPTAARNALESNPEMSSEGMDDIDGVARSGDNDAVTKSEAKYSDPERDSRFRCVLPDEIREAKQKVGKIPDSIASGAVESSRKTGRNAGRAGVAADAVHGGSSEKAQCVVCHDEVQGCLFMPCNHLCTCPNCAVKISKCPVCDKDIMHRLRVYLG